MCNKLESRYPLGFHILQKSIILLTAYVENGNNINKIIVVVKLATKQSIS